MKDKRLKQLTIIPGDLYVTRDADRQVRQIINEMGRPGYVLVARQMGKTNLLLNARRALSTAEDHFVYVDVSNGFPTLREFFRSIVETSLAAREDRFELLGRLSEMRERTFRMPEHQEHESELIFLLEKINGKLVICLDEVDALVKTNYSDNVFAFIRSVYFSGRTNIPSFLRLTYLLSGVAEPAELIKNKNISPFNIGEKIYLDDFSRQEMRLLASRSSVDIPEEVIERVYHWTNGHPRLSWHLLSLIEDRLLVGDQIIAQVVDEMVKEAYLTAFDLPPVDHIRTLVQDDREVRDALMSMHYSYSSSITAVVRGKLYLNGITAGQGLAGEVHLKNRILEAALSVEWLQELDHQDGSLHQRAAEAYDSKNYRRAIELYSQYLSSGEDRTMPAGSYTDFGLSYYFSEDYVSAAKNLEKDSITADISPALYAMNRFHLASSCAVTGRSQDAERYFGEVVSLGNKPAFRALYLRSILNVIAIRLSDPAADLLAALAACQEVIDQQADTEGVLGDDEGIIKAAAHYLVFRVREAQGEAVAAENSLRRAISFAKGDSRTSLLVLLASSLKDISAKRVALSEVLELIESTRPAISLVATDALAFSEDYFGRILHTSIVVGDRSLQERLISYLSNGAVDPDRAQRVVLQCIYGNIKQYTREQLNSSIIMLLDKFSGVEFIHLRRALLSLLSFSGIESLRGNWISELEAAFGDDSYNIGEDSLNTIVNILKRFVLAGRADDVARLFAALEARKFPASVKGGALLDATSWGLVGDYLGFLAAKTEGDEELAGDLCTSISRLLNGYQNLKVDVKLSRVLLDAISRDVGLYLKSGGKSRVATVVRSDPKIGRNEIVRVLLSNGEEVYGKYKKFEKALKSGEAVIQ